MTSNYDDVIILEDDDDDSNSEPIVTEISLKTINTSTFLKTESKRLNKFEKSDDDSNDKKNNQDLTDSNNDDSNHAKKAKITNKNNKKLKTDNDLKETESVKYDHNASELEAAAAASRLTHDKMTLEEASLFSDIIDEEKKNHIENYKLFLYIRNKIVCFDQFYFKIFINYGYLSCKCGLITQKFN